MPSTKTERPAPTTGHAPQIDRLGGEIEAPPITLLLPATTGRPESQIYYLFSQGHLGNAVWKMSRKNCVASRAKLAALAGKLAAESLKNFRGTDGR